MSRIISHDHAERVERLACAIEGELNELPPIAAGGTDPRDYLEARNRYYEAVEEMTLRLRDHRDGNMSITPRWEGCAVACWRLRSSSTSGVEGALRNWVTQARTKVAAFRADHGKERA